jgi:hypothetical protein
VWANEGPDASFGVTSPVFLEQLTTSGTLVGTPLDVTAALGNALATSFSSKSELALNLSTDGSAVTFMAYESPTNALDVSNSNTPGHIDLTNPVGGYPVNTPPTQRAVVEIDAYGQLVVTPVNAYSGNNGRAATLATARPSPPGPPSTRSVGMAAGWSKSWSSSCPSPAAGCGAASGACGTAPRTSRRAGSGQSSSSPSCPPPPSRWPEPSTWTANRARRPFPFPQTD